jgi:mRNA interferase MazF
VKRGELRWAELDPPAGRRPVVILTRTNVISVLSNITVAPLSTIIRGIASEVQVGAREGLTKPSVISCDNVITVPQAHLDDRPIGTLGPGKVDQLDAALRFALGIRH